VSDTQQEPANPLPSGDCLTTIRTRPSPLFWAVDRLIDACEDLFDLVIELAEEALQIWLSALFDGTGPQNSQGNIFEEFFGISAFTLAVSMDRPTNIPNLPANSTDLLDVNIGITDVAAIRMVVGLVVDRTQPTRDRVLVDFANRLHHLSVTFIGLPIPGTDAPDFFLRPWGGRDLWADVDRATTDAQELMQWT
jgi:hypothetical protein